MGNYFLSNLSKMRSPYIKAVRGRGLMLAVELMPAAGGARRYCETLMSMGLLCKETHENTIRFAPPLIITREEIDWALERIETVLKSG
jgi:ornithine--oxo-acid transaminase